MTHARLTPFVPLNVAVLTVSDTRDEATDKSGQYLVQALQTAGHQVVDKVIVADDKYQLRAVVCAWIASQHVQAVLVTGGTGFSARDVTPEALQPLFDKHIEGFGELFRHVSYSEIGSSTMQSRALAGLSNGTVIFCLPGSTGACKTGWSIIEPQLDASHKPCNFIPQLKTAAEASNEGE